MRHCLLCNGAAREQDVVVLLLTFFFFASLICASTASDESCQTCADGCWYRRRLWHVRTSVCVCTWPLSPPVEYTTHIRTQTHTHKFPERYWKCKKATSSLLYPQHSWYINLACSSHILWCNVWGKHNWHLLCFHQAASNVCEAWEMGSGRDGGRRLKVALANLEICFLKLQYVMIFFLGCTLSAFCMRPRLKYRILLP